MFDESAERAVIAAALFDDSVVVDISAVITPADFYIAAHRAIWQQVVRLHAAGTTVDAVTLGDAVREDGHTGLAGQIALDAFTAANASSYAKIVSDWSRRRAVIAACRQAVADAPTAEPGALIADLAGRLEGAGAHALGESLDMHTVMTRMMNEIEQATKADGGVVGVRTGIPMIDGALGGLCPTRLIVLAARPSIGKTALSLQIAVNAARNGVPGGICSLEMSDTELAARMNAYHATANFTRLIRGRDDALSRMVAAWEDHNPKEWPLHLDVDTYDLAGIEARITSWKRRHGIKFAVVDYIGLVEVEGDKSTYDRVSLVSRRLKKLAKRLDIAIIAVAQLNRALEKERRKPTLADLRDSGNIEQDIDIGMFLHVDPEDIDAQPVPVQIGFLKNRTGRRGWQREALMFDGQTQTFREQAVGYEDRF